MICTNELLQMICQNYSFETKQICCLLSGFLKPLYNPISIDDIYYNFF